MTTVAPMYSNIHKLPLRHFFIFHLSSSANDLVTPVFEQGNVCGLCGNFDGDGQNDFTTQGQLVVSNALEFANSWKVSSTCPDMEENLDTCEVSNKRHHWAKMMCSIITGATFKECHNKVSRWCLYCEVVSFKILNSLLKMNDHS